MKVLVVVGARPNFMKAAPILKAIRAFNSAHEWSEPMEPILVHTGQHYDAQMSDAFFADLEMPQPDVFLGAGSGSHAEQTAEIMKRFERVLLEQKPQALLVVGDVNSTLACALAAAKLPPRLKPLIAHVEAVLRSFDRAMPEEINRILTDQISDVLFVTEESGLRHLQTEGIPRAKIHFVGNTMIDTLRACETRADLSTVLPRLGVTKREYALLTLHRAANVDDRDSFVEILSGLRDLAATQRVIFPAHPRTQKQIRDLGLESFFAPAQGGGIAMVAPQPYLDFLCLMKNARLVITDSGGIQEETTALGVPCVTVRDNTERPVTIELGSNVLAGTRCETIRQGIRLQLASRLKNAMPPLWDGRAAGRIIAVLANHLLPLVPVHLEDAAGQMQENAR